MANKTNIRILALVLATITMLFCFVSCAQVPGEEETTQALQRGEFVPPEFDATAVRGVPKIVNPDSIGYTELDAKAYKVSVCGRVEVNGNKADIYFTNPDSNSAWLKLRVLNAKGEVIAETGLVRPGEYIQTITFTKIPKTDDPITMRVMGYEPVTYYSVGEVSFNTVIFQ